MKGVRWAGILEMPSYYSLSRTSLPVKVYNLAVER